MCKILLKLYHLLKEAILKWREGCYSLEGSREGQSPAASSSLLSAAQLCTNFFLHDYFTTTSAATALNSARNREQQDKIVSIANQWTQLPVEAFPE